MCVPVSSEGIIQGDFKKQTVLKVKACSVQCTLKCMIEKVETIRSRGGGGRVPPRNYAFVLPLRTQRHIRALRGWFPPRRVDITTVLYTWTSAVSTHPCPTSRMVPSASNGTICYCLISEKLLMLPGSRGKCVKGGGTRIWQGLYKRSERHQRQEKGRKREMAEFESFSFPTKCHCSQLESSGSNHPEHLLVKHAAHRQIQEWRELKGKTI